MRRLAVFMLLFAPSAYPDHDGPGVFYEDEVKAYCDFYGAGYADALSEMDSYKRANAAQIGNIVKGKCVEHFRSRAEAGKIILLPPKSTMGID